MQGNGELIFNNLIKNAKGRLPSGSYVLDKGIIINKHISTTTGEFTIDINNKGKIYKIRIR